MDTLAVFDALLIFGIVLIVIFVRLVLETPPAKMKHSTEFLINVLMFLSLIGIFWILSFTVERIVFDKVENLKSALIELCSSIAVLILTIATMIRILLIKRNRLKIHKKPSLQ